MSTAGSGDREFGHLLVERSGGIGGFLLVWDLDIDTSKHREELGERVADLPWPRRGDGHAGASGAGGQAAATGAAPGGSVSSADRYVYLIESRFGHARFGEKELTGEWKELVDHVRDVAEPERRRPGAD